MSPEKEQTLDEKMNKLASEIGRNPDAFDDDAWMQLFDASMNEMLRQQNSMSEEELEALHAKDLVGFEQVKKRLEKKTLKEMTLGEVLEKSGEVEAALKPFSWRKRKKVFLLAAAVAVLGLGTTMMVQGNREYELKQYSAQGKRNVTVNYNSVLRLDQSGNLDDAYKQIQTALDIDVFELENIPSDMKFKKLVLNRNTATLQFVLNGRKVFFKQRKISDISEESDIVASDRNAENRVYNEWLNREIAIEKNKLENGEIEYSAGFNEKNISCCLMGIMEEEIFLDLVKGIH